MKVPFLMGKSQSCGHDVCLLPLAGMATCSRPPRRACGTASWTTLPTLCPAMGPSVRALQEENRTIKREPHGTLCKSMILKLHANLRESMP